MLEPKRVLYYLADPDSVYAGRYVFEGYRNAFHDMGHTVKTYSPGQNFDRVVDEFRPDILMYALDDSSLKSIDFAKVRKMRDEGMRVICQVRAWQDLDLGIAAPSRGLIHFPKQTDLIRDGLAGDIYWHWFEQDEPSMEGFADVAGKKHETVLLAADKTVYYPQFDKEFECQMCYVGTYLPLKKEFLDRNVIPLKKKYDLRLYGNDWTMWNWALGRIQGLGRRLGISQLRALRKQAITYEHERKLYSSSKICLNVHEKHVRENNLEINERVFKIPACGGFELTDHVPIMRRYFNERELVTAQNEKEWFEKIKYYIDNPEERISIIEAGKKKVLERHTYHNRVSQLLELCSKLKS